MDVGRPAGHALESGNPASRIEPRLLKSAAREGRFRRFDCLDPMKPLCPYFEQRSWTIA